MYPTTNQLTDILRVYLPHQLFLSLRTPGSLPMDHLITDDPQRPNITSIRVLIMLQGLWGHVQGRPYIVFVPAQGLLLVDGEPEVCYFELVILDQDIGWLQVSVDYLVGIELPVPLNQLGHIVQYLSLCEFGLNLC